MDKTNFRNTLIEQLETLSRKQILEFSWKCSVRTLPLLGKHGNFRFWKSELRQKYLYAIFNALDIIPFTSEFNITYAAVFASSASIESYTAARNAIQFFEGWNTAALVANAIGNAVNATFVKSDKEYALNTAINAFGAANNLIDIEPILLEDLANIKYNVNSRNEDTLIYGKIWDNFHSALENEGCEYWSILYKEIFSNGLTYDKKTLESRMNVPKEIREQGAATVGNYLKELQKGATRLNEARIIILGDKGAGKTCLARKLIDPRASMTTDKESTAGVNISLWKLKRENINIRIWDFAGHTITHTVHQFFLSERCLYIIVYDGRTEDRNRLIYWLNHMKNYGGNSQAIIFVNKRDEHSVNLPVNYLKERYSILSFYTFSIKEDNKDLDALREYISLYIKNNPSWNNQTMPISYYCVKDELEYFFSGKNKDHKEHITRSDLEDIAKNNGVENVEKLLQDLHTLGVSLWYKHLETFNTIILNPEWISHGVYQVINWVNEERRYSINLDDFQKVFKENRNRYPQEKHEFIFRLMKHYELAYETQDKCLIIPHLLKEDRPSTLPEFLIGDSLMLRYKAEQPLPPNTISRFIVRHHKEIKKSEKNYLVWRYGVILETFDGTIALVREEDRTITVSVKGSNKKNYMNDLRSTLNDIFNSYKNEKPELQYRVERFGELPSNDQGFNIPIWLSDRKIFNHTKERIPYYEDFSGQHIDLYNTLNEYNITAQNLISGEVHQFIDKSNHSAFLFQRLQYWIARSFE